MNQSELTRLFEDFNHKTALIIGDVMIDSYLIGKVTRISPEAPVPIVSVTENEKRLGGAANVAINVKALGAKAIMASVVSNDEKGNEFINILKKEGLPTQGILQSSGRKTTVKTRIISNYQQLLRVDDEEIKPLIGNDLQNFIVHISQIIENQTIDVIIFQDYDKGIITPELIRAVVKLAKHKGIFTTADPKKNNFLAFHDVDLFKPNLKELREGLNVNFATTSEHLTKAFSLLQDSMNIGAALFTLSEKGVFAINSNMSHQHPAHLRNIADVSGAGDTVISVASLCLACGTSLSHLAKLSNLAGGLVCEQIGVVPINKERLMEEAILSNE